MRRCRHTPLNIGLCYCTLLDLLCFCIIVTAVVGFDFSIVFVSYQSIK